MGSEATLFLAQFLSRTTKMAKVDIKGDTVILDTGYRKFLFKMGVSKIDKKKLEKLITVYIPELIVIFGQRLAKWPGKMTVRVDVYDKRMFISVIAPRGKSKVEVFRADLNVARAKDPRIGMTARDGLVDATLMRSINELFEKVMKNVY